MSKLTSRTLATGATLNDFIHIVITGDTSQSAQGSSYKARLSQLVPLFGGPDVFVTGGTYSNVTGTATFRNTTGGTFNVSGFTTGTTIPTEIFVTGGTSNSTGGTMTFTNTTGGTFTVTGTTTPFTGGSGNCITSFYTNNIHACIDEITVHNRVQSVGSDAQSILSFAFGNNVQALNRYTHAEGEDTIASGQTSHAEGDGTISFGSYSHAEGISAKTGTNLAYLATGLTSGVLYLSSTYGNVFLNFTAGQYMLINDTNYGGFIQDSYVVSAATYNTGTSQTIVYLTDTLLTTAGSGSILVGNTSSPSLWGGNMVMGGYGANSKGSLTNAIGNYTLSLGVSTSAIGNNSFASGKGTSSYGLHSFSTGLNGIAYGLSSFVGGESTITKGVSAFAIGHDTKAIGDLSFSHGYQTESRGNRTVTIGGQLNIVDSGTTDNSGIFGGESNLITPILPSDPLINSAIIGGYGNIVKGFNSGIVASKDSIMLSNYSVILGGSGITGTNVSTVYVPKLVLYSAYTYTPSGTTDTTVGEVGSVTWDNNYFYYRDNIGWKRISGATWI
jgi:hypothetical protein